MELPMEDLKVLNAPSNRKIRIMSKQGYERNFIRIRTPFFIVDLGTRPAHYKGQ